MTHAFSFTGDGKGKNPTHHILLSFMVEGEVVFFVDIVKYFVALNECFAHHAIGVADDVQAALGLFAEGDFVHPIIP